MARTMVKEKLPFSPGVHRAREIRWHPWGHNAFRAAKREGKPILMAMTTWWCDECHRMDETTYSDPQVIDRINAGYVAIRVDADRRPDVADRYTLGGWPTTALLASTGELLTSGGFIPPAEMSALLDRVSLWYQDSQADLRREIADMELRRQELLRCVGAPEGQPTRELLEGVAGEILRLYDPLYGGFGDQPKFPNGEAVRFALERSTRPGGEGWREIATRSLDALAAGLSDPVEGGFFHSADRRDWTDVHTEKLLEVNADLLRLYLEAFQTTGDVRYRDVAERTLAYLGSTLRNPDSPTFAGSQAADPRYYQMDGEKRRETQPPPVDRTVFAEENARAAFAYLLAYQLLGDPAHLRTATELLGFLWREMADPADGVVRYWDRQPGGPRLLRDQLWLASALAEAYDVVGDDSFLEQATTLAEVILRDYTGMPGGFYDVRAERDAVATLANRQWNLVDNAQLALLMDRLSEFGGDGRYREAARSALQIFAEDYSRFGALAASYARAMEAYLRGKGD
ncbi:MAG: DUF255 domain-containing protein [Chloroflexota bacterium]